jgi:hypothetical protein
MGIVYYYITKENCPSLGNILRLPPTAGTGDLRKWRRPGYSGTVSLFYIARLSPTPTMYAKEFKLGIPGKALFQAESSGKPH